MAHPGGRPTKYDDEVLVKTEEYFKRATFPTIEGLSLSLDLDTDTINEWIDKEGKYYKPQFSVTVRKLLARQSHELQEKGLTGEFNAQMSKFLLSANHNKREKSDVTTNDETMNNGPILVKWDDEEE